MECGMEAEAPVCCACHLKGVMEWIEEGKGGAKEPSRRRTRSTGKASYGTSRYSSVEGRDVEMVR